MPRWPSEKNGTRARDSGSVDTVRPACLSAVAARLPPFAPEATIQKEFGGACSTDENSPTFTARRSSACEISIRAQRHGGEEATGSSGFAMMEMILLGESVAGVRTPRAPRASPESRRKSRRVDFTPTRLHGER